MHESRRFFRREVDVTLHIGNRDVRDQEAIAVAVQLHAAGGVLAVDADNGEVAGTGFEQGAGSRKTLQSEFEVVTRTSLYAQFANKLLEVCTGVGQLRNVIEEGTVGKSERGFIH
jgi:hypothetical protein